MGQSFVRKARKAGANVFFSYRTRAAAAKELQELGAASFSLDLADMRAIERLAGELEGKIDGLDVLIHNAAEACDRTIAGLSEKEWDRALNVNLKAPFYLTKQLLPLLFKRRPSKIFIMTSRLAFSGGGGAAAYSAAKAGLVAFAKSLARELGRKRVLVNAVNPGFMMSSMTETLPAEVLEKNRQSSLLKEFSDPDQVADFLVWLCSDRMRQVTGHVFHYESRPVF